MPETEKPLNSYDLDVISDYVATLKTPQTLNQSTMPETTFEENYLDTIQEVLTFLDNSSEILNQVIVTMLGEDSDWSEFVGVDDIPIAYLDKFKPEEKSFAKKLWAMREQSNSILNWNGDHDLLEWVKDLAKGVKPDPETESQNLYLKAQNKQLQANHDRELTQIRNYNDIHFNQFKADVLIALKAIELCAIASVRRDSYSPRQERRARLEQLSKTIQGLSSDSLETSKLSLINELKAVSQLQERDQCLTHRERDERLRHLQQVISNAFEDFSDRRITRSYDDNF